MENCMVCSRRWPLSVTHAYTTVENVSRAQSLNRPTLGFNLFGDLVQNILPSIVLLQARKSVHATCEMWILTRVLYETIRSILLWPDWDMFRDLSLSHYISLKEVSRDFGLCFIKRWHQPCCNETLPSTARQRNICLLSLSVISFVLFPFFFFFGWVFLI